MFGRLRRGSTSAAADDAPRVLVLTPLKDAVYWLPTYVDLLYRMTYPRQRISLGFLESDSTDGTFDLLRRYQEVLHRDFRRALIWKKDFDYSIPEGMDRHTESIQVERRSVLARSRNHLLFHALDDEDWVLWMDVDLLDYPEDIIQRLLATGKQIIQPHCVVEYGGPTYDANAWTQHGRYHMDSMRDSELVRLDAVGGTMLLVRADLHRDGLIFPTFLYGRDHPLSRPERGEIETEGLGILAHDMGLECWGLPNLEVRHQPY
jgi:peptide chain release factor subunit 1